MPFCIKCGVSITSDSKYCHNCGSPINHNSIISSKNEIEDLSPKEKKEEPKIAADVNVTMTKKSPVAENVLTEILSNKQKIKSSIFNNKFVKYWVALHVTIFVLSLTGASFFNSISQSKSKEYLWPFSGVTVKESKYPYSIYSTEKVTKFTGLFYGYDISELIIYLLLGMSFPIISKKLKSL